MPESCSPPQPPAVDWHLSSPHASPSRQSSSVLHCSPDHSPGTPSAKTAASTATGTRARSERWASERSRSFKLGMDGLLPKHMRNGRGRATLLCLVRQIGRTRPPLQKISPPLPRNVHAWSPPRTWRQECAHSFTKDRRSFAAVDQRKAHTLVRAIGSSVEATPHTRRRSRTGCCGLTRSEAVGRRLSAERALAGVRRGGGLADREQNIVDRERQGRIRRGSFVDHGADDRVV